MKRIKTVLFAIVAIVCCSCSNKDAEDIYNAPTFKIVSFGKTEDLYSVEMKVEGLHGRFSIDGLIKENEINSIEIIAPNSQSIGYNITRKYDDVNLIKIYGNYAENITIKINWICHEKHDNYLIGWHLDYGFGRNCEVLMVNLNSNF